MSESVKNLMETSGDDKSLGNIAVDENVLANASTADSTIPNDSQSFTLADFDSSLQEIDSKKNKDNEGMYYLFIFL